MLFILESLMKMLNNPFKLIHHSISICMIEKKFFIKIFIEIFQVRPVIDLATKRIRDDGILPDYVNITWHEFDDECESAISSISAFDAYRSKCSHFILGPACEYSVGKHLIKSLCLFSLRTS
jgi:hypothetical protein